MDALLRRNTVITAVLLLCTPWVCLGCGDFDREFGGGGSDKSGSLFNVESIEPIYFENPTRQVDVFQNAFCSGDPEDPDPEDFTDHFANVIFSNRPLPNSEEQTASTIYLTRYEVSYQPLTQGSPVLTPFTVTTIDDYVGILPCDVGAVCEGEMITGVEFVPVRLKNELAQFILDTGISQLEYNIRYVFFGENDYGYDVSADGATYFLASNYDNCSN